MGYKFCKLRTNPTHFPSYKEPYNSKSQGTTLQQTLSLLQLVLLLLSVEHAMIKIKS